jgi:hypothetical protein
MRRLHMDAAKPFYEDVLALADKAEAIGNPKALYRVARIDEKRDDAIVAEGVTLTSRVLRVNVEEAHRLFLYVATCGTELAEWGKCLDDPLLGYAADIIGEMVLVSALQAMHAHIDEHYHPGHLATMNPGSLADWPLPQQAPLFSLLGDVEGQIGVRLLDSFLMVPAKSVSGLRFPTETNYENCQLCQMPECPGRRAPFHPQLWEKKYQKK